ISLPTGLPLFPYTTLFRSVLADRRSDERDQGAVVGHGRGDEVVGVQRGRGVGAGRAAEEQRVLAVREDEQVGDLVPQTLRLERRSEEHTSELQSRVDLVCR